jgi:hypothetical protein
MQNEEVVKKDGNSILFKTNFSACGSLQNLAPNHASHSRWATGPHHPFAAPATLLVFT